MMNDAISIVSGILMMILILMMAYGASRFLGKHWRAVGKGKYMEVVDHLVLGQDKELLIVRLEQEDKCVLLGSGSEGVRLLCELSDNYPREANKGVYPSGLSGSFSEVLEKWKKAAELKKQERLDE